MSRIFQVGEDHHGEDVMNWQRTLNTQLSRWHADPKFKIAVDGVYGVKTRAITSKVLYGLGIPQSAMRDGVTPALRIKVRHRDLTPGDRVRYAKRARWRKKLAHGKVAYPVHNLISDDWGFHPPIHDGVDLICPEGEPLHAICDGVIVRADAGGWWGKGAPADPALKARGDGIVILESTVNVGPFKKGLHFCYGHAEHDRVKPGDHVRAGQVIALAGFANAGHTHFMVNDDPPQGGFHKGIGDRDPMPYLTYAKKHQ